MALIIRQTGFDDFLDRSGGAWVKCLILGNPDVGKGHPLGTPLLTPGGYVELGKLAVGDLVIGSDGEPTEITAIHERGILPLKRVTFHDGTSILVDPEHLWQVRDHHGFQVLQTQNLGALDRDAGGGRVLRWEVPLVAPVQHPRADLPLHPYVLGTLLANGQSVISDLGLAGVLSGRKVIPERYLFAAEDQRRLLLAGLMDADGGMKGRTPWYYSTSPQLAADVAELVRSLGGVASIKVIPREDKPTEHNVKVLLDVNPFCHGPKVSRWAGPSRRLSRKIADVADAGFGEVRCLSVAAPDHLYVAQNHTVTHNTRSASFWPKPIFADCEDGRMSIADRKTAYARVRSSADMDALLEELRKDSLRPQDKRHYLTFVVDTLDSYQRILIQERLRSEKKESLSGWADWGWLDGKMQQFIEKLLNLNMNIVVNLHVKEETVGDDDSRMLIKKPRLKGDIKESVLQEFDLIGHMETSYRAEGGQRVRTRQIRWHNEPTFPFLKDRSGRLPRFTDIDFTDGDFQRIFDAITAGVDDLPESQELGSIEVPEEASAAGAEEKGGPVAVGSLPKKAVKRAPAKKAAETRAQANRAAGGKATVTERQPEQARPEQAEQEKVVNGRGTADEPVVLPASVTGEQVQTFVGKLDHVHSTDGTCLKNQFGEMCETETSTDVESSEPVVDEPAEASATEAVETVKERLGGEVIATERPEKYCGLQPPTYKKFTDAPEGCGKDLAGENTAKVNLSLLRAHAMLCADCMEKWKSAKSA